MNCKKARWIFILVISMLLIGCKKIFEFHGKSSEFQINSYAVNRQWNPCVAKLTKGGFVVVWRSEGQDGSGSGIFCQIFDSIGKKVKEEFQVNLYDLGNQCSPSVTGLSDGGFVIVWQSIGHQNEALGTGCFGQVFDDIGNRRGNRLQFVDSSIYPLVAMPSVAALNNGGFVVVWDIFSGLQKSGWDIYGQRFDAIGRKIGSWFSVNSYRKDVQFRSKVIGSKDGGFIVIWMSHGQNGVSRSIIGQLFDEKGMKLGNEFIIFALPENARPDIACLDNENFIVVCESGRNCNVSGQLFDSHGNKLGTGFRVNTYNKSTQGNPAVTDLKHGKFVVIWESLNQENSAESIFRESKLPWKKIIHHNQYRFDKGIFGQVFDSNAEKKGKEFRVNSFIENDQESPSVANLGNGRFIVVWQSEGQDGDDYGIFGRIYKDNDRKWF
ncbi:MAG: hypothetical protein ACMUJM_00355 [bacterium]